MILDQIKIVIFLKLMRLINNLLFQDALKLVRRDRTVLAGSGTNLNQSSMSVVSRHQPNFTDIGKGVTMI